jgi:hypothetical protein
MWQSWFYYRQDKFRKQLKYHRFKQMNYAFRLKPNWTNFTPRPAKHRSRFRNSATTSVILTERTS